MDGRPVCNQCNPISVSLWNKSSHADQPDAFLGQITLPIKDLMRTRNEADEWIPLQKRSARSHVSGQVRVVTSPLQVI